MIDKGSVVFKQSIDQFADWFVPELRCLLKIANNLSPENPQIVDVLSNRLLRRPGSGEVE